MNPVRTWRHSRKGLITGRIVREDDAWAYIALEGDHRLRYGSESNRGRIDRDGDVIVARKSLLIKNDIAPRETN